MVKMQLGDKGEKGTRYAEQSVKEAQKKLDEAKEKQSKEKSAADHPPHQVDVDHIMNGN